MPKEESTYSYYLKVYNRLSRSRSMNGTIPLSEILAYANNIELISSIDEFIDVINMIDSIQVEFHREVDKQKKDKEQKEQKKQKK